MAVPVEVDTLRISVIYLHRQGDRLAELRRGKKNMLTRMTLELC